jgi:hypothetical protein
VITRLLREAKEYNVKYYKVIDFEYQDFEDQEWDSAEEGYTESAVLAVTVQEEGTANKYTFYFDGVKVYTAVKNYRHYAATRLEPAEDDWVDMYMEMTEDCYPLVYDVTTVSGPELTEEEPSEKEQRYILNQIGAGRIEL